LWILPTGDEAGFGTLINRRAIEAGLTFRPLVDTAKDTLAWLATVPEPQHAKFKSSGIKPDKEQQVLAAWHAEGH
jgi:2'-hydroxyisoflavone reductase